jgi:ABC-2 type transport system permease protein
MIPFLQVDRRRAIGDIRLLLTATVMPVVFIFFTGLLAGSPKEPIGMVHPSPRLLHLAQENPGLRVKIEATKADLVDDILRGRVVGGIVTRPSAAGAISVQFVAQTYSTSAVQARTDVVALLDLISAEGSHTHFTNTLLAHTHIPTPLSPFSYVAPADLVLFMGITLLVLSAGQVETKQSGMLRRLAAAPVRQRTIVAAQVANKLVIATAQAIGLLFLGVEVFGVHWGNPLAVALIVVFLALSLAGLSVLVGVWAKTQEQAIALSVVVGIAFGMLGGCMYPLDVVGNAVRMVGHAVPQAWAMDAFVKLIYHHAGIVSVLPEIGALAGFGVALCALAAWAYARTMYSPG